MSEITSRIPFDRGTGKYKNTWWESQEQQVSHFHSELGRMTGRSVVLTECMLMNCCVGC